jgi:hypothetical protein
VNAMQLALKRFTWYYPRATGNQNISRKNRDLLLCECIK